jgi:hypothetical protein
MMKCAICGGEIGTAGGQLCGGCRWPTVSEENGRIVVQFPPIPTAEGDPMNHEDILAHLITEHALLCRWIADGRVQVERLMTRLEEVQALLETEREEIRLRSQSPAGSGQAQAGETTTAGGVWTCQEEAKGETEAMDPG